MKKNEENVKKEAIGMKEPKFIDPKIAEKDMEKGSDEFYKKYKGSGKQEKLKIPPGYISDQAFIDDLRQLLSKGLQNEEEDVIYFLRALSNVSDSMVMRTYKTLFNAIYEAVIMKKYKHKRSDIEKWLKGSTADVDHLIDVFKQCGIYVSAPGEPNTYQVTDFFRNLITYGRTPKGIPFSKENFKGFVFFIVLSNVPGAGKRIYSWIARAMTQGVMSADRKKEQEVECTKCKKRYKANHLIKDELKISVDELSPQNLKELLEEHKIKCPGDKGELKFLEPLNLIENGEALILRRFFTRVALEEQIPEKRMRDLMFDISGREEPLFDDYFKKNDEYYIKVKSPVVKIILRCIERVREKERKRTEK